jgi:hypothetical protein
MSEKEAIKAVKLLAVRAWVYKDICRGFLDQRQLESVSWFFHDLHDRILRMFNVQISDREFEDILRELHKELSQMTRRPGQ